MIFLEFKVASHYTQAYAYIDKSKYLQLQICMCLFVQQKEKCYSTSIIRAHLTGSYVKRLLLCYSRTNTLQLERVYAVKAIIFVWQPTVLLFSSMWICVGNCKSLSDSAPVCLCECERKSEWVYWKFNFKNKHKARSHEIGWERESKVYIMKT